MEDREKAHTAIPESPAQKFIQKADRRDKAMRTVEVFVLLALIVFSGLAAIGLRNVINQDQHDAIARSTQAKQDRDEQKNYIKCLALLQFDVPKDQLSTRAGAEKALDDCAKKTGTQ